MIGLRIGMAPDQAREMFKSHGFGSSTKSRNRPFDSYAEGSNTLAFDLSGQAPQPVPHTNYVARISGAINDIKYPATESSGEFTDRILWAGSWTGENRVAQSDRVYSGQQEADC